MHTSKSKPRDSHTDIELEGTAALMTQKQVFGRSPDGAGPTSSGGCAIVPPPSAVRHFAVDRVPSPQRIDYAAHPAYSEFTRPGLATRVTATSRFLMSLLPLAAKRLTNYELIPNEVRMRRDVAGRLRLAGAGLANVSVRARNRSAAVSPLALALTSDGVVVVVTPATALARVEAASAGAFAQLERARAARSSGSREFEESRFHADRRKELDLFAAVDTFLVEAGVLQAASEYIGRPARLIDVNPQINDSSDSFWREIFPDRESASLPRTAYFHRDASGGDLKAIVYLSDVGPANGPFGFVLGSHRLPISRLDDFICEANDHNGLAHTSPDWRRRFAALPTLFRQKGAFGNDLPDEHPASEEIGSAAWSITGSKGSIVLFDTKGIHRGGMVEQGERRVITCVIG